MNVKDSVLERYSEGAREVQPSLCCPVSYDPALLDQLPDEIIDKDYGCGDPSAYVRPGDTVLDLGSGGGKICYIAAQLVGKQGKVIGVDMNDDMLKLARKYQSEMAKKIGYHNTVFHKGHIQDLAIDLERMHTWLQNNPIQNTVDLDRLDAWKAGQRSNHPMIGDNSVDLVISNCVLNLVDDTLKTNLVQEIFRVLKPGGRIAISDIVSDELCPETLKHDPRLWSGCLSGAFQEKDFLDAFTRSGFISVMI
ncbi:MAG: methyltransferase domain-containing protein, partial [Gammaproteobacteria bacterium]|nr:methyltransferase domain-containing protein [Gammaproteobacteria bacterium]